MASSDSVLGKPVEAVVDRLDLGRRDPDLLDGEPPQRVGDRDDSGRKPCDPALDVPERPGAEGVVVVLRRHHLRAAESSRDGAVDVRVDEMRVDDVDAQRAEQLRQRERVGAQPQGRDVERVVEVGRVPRGVVEADEDDVETAIGERRQQRQQVPLRAPDAAHLVNVRDSHVPRRSWRRASAATASNASRKSNAMRYRVAPTNAAAQKLWYANSASASQTKARGARKSPTAASA